MECCSYLTPEGIPQSPQKGLAIVARGWAVVATVHYIDPSELCFFDKSSSRGCSELPPLSCQANRTAASVFPTSELGPFLARLVPDCSLRRLDWPM